MDEPVLAGVVSRSQGRIPPHSLDAEAALLGAALIRQQIVGDMRNYVAASDFYKPSHQNIWQAMLDLYEKGEPVDVVTVGHAVARFDIMSPELLDLQNATPAVSAAHRYAETVVETSRRRRLMRHLAELSDRLYVEEADNVLADLEPDASLMISDPTKGVPGLSRIDEFLGRTRGREDIHDWIIPHTLKPRWRQLIVAEEGVGKGTLMRFLGVHVAAGRDPWNPRNYIDARRVLNIDCENPDSSIELQLGLANQQYAVEKEATNNFFLWHREGGINLRDRRAQAELERVLQQTRPELVIAGPLYKLYRRQAREDMEQATIEMLQVLDDFRVRFNFAIIVEHHAPKGEGGHRRDMLPFGSSALMRWPEHGITLEITGNPKPDEERLELRCGRFRRDREPMDFPTSIIRGGMYQQYAWLARFDHVGGRNRFGWPYPPQGEGE